MADRAILLSRLRQLNVEVSDGASPEDIADLVKSHRIEWAVCCRINDRPATFRQAFEAVYGRQLDGSELPVRKERKRV